MEYTGKLHKILSNGKYDISFSDELNFIVGVWKKGVKFGLYYNIKTYEDAYKKYLDLIWINPIR